MVGLGAIGASVAHAAIALGMKVVGFDPMLSVEAALRLPGGAKSRFAGVCAFFGSFKKESSLLRTS